MKESKSIKNTSKSLQVLIATENLSAILQVNPWFYPNLIWQNWNSSTWSLALSAKT